jgi:ribose transport system substrate-binding protein
MSKVFTQIAGATSLVAGVLLAGSALADGVGLAFSPLSLDIPALKGLSEGVKAVGGGMGYDVVVLDPKFDAPTQADQLNQVLTTGRVKAAWIMSVNQGSMKGVIEAAQAAGAVLVVNGEPKDYGFDGMIPGVTFAKIDYAIFGGKAGELAGQCANDKLGGAGKALLIQSKEGTAGKADIDSQTAAQLAATSPGTEVVATVVTSERAETLDKVSQVLQAHPDINVVVASHDEGGLGALGAFEAAGLTVPCIVDAGGNDEVLKAVADGKMYASVALNFQADLMQTFDSIGAMLKDPTAPGTQTAVPLDIKTK